MDLEKLVAEGQLIWNSFKHSLKTTKWYVYLAKLSHVVFFIVGMLISASIVSYTLGYIVILITITYVAFYALWLRKRIELKV